MKTKKREFGDYAILLRFPHEDVVFDYLPTLNCSVIGTDGDRYLISEGAVFDLTMTPPTIIVPMIADGPTKRSIVDELIVTTTPKKEQANENNL